LPLGGIFDVETKSQRLEEVNGLLEDPKIWSDNAKSQALGKEKRELGLVVEALIYLQSGLQDAQDLFDMAREENDDATLLSVASDAQALEKQIAEMEFRRMFSGPMDANNCFIEFQSGSGGTEAQDWCNMLLRMYLRYTERWNYPMATWPALKARRLRSVAITLTAPCAQRAVCTVWCVNRLLIPTPSATPRLPACRFSPRWTTA
jgi:protein subunit release factor A